MTDYRTLNTKINLFTDVRGVPTGLRRQTNSVLGKKKCVCDKKTGFTKMSINCLTVSPVKRQHSSWKVQQSV